MYIHGGGWFVGDKYTVQHKVIKANVEKILAKGIAVAAINYRLIDKERKYIFVKDCIADVKDAFAYLNKHANKLRLNREKMAVWGASAGGHLTMMLAFSDLEDFPGDKMLKKYRKKPNTIVTWYGASTFEVLESEDLEAEMEKLTQLHKRFTPSKDWNTRREAAKEISPLRYIDKEDPSALLMGGEKDKIVKIDQAYKAHEALNKNNIKNKIVVVKNAEHNWAGVNIKPNLDEICGTTAEYLYEKIGK